MIRLGFLGDSQSVWVISETVSRFVGSFAKTVSSLEDTCAATYVKAGRSPIMS